MKKILSLFLSVLMLTGMVTIGFSASAATVDSGTCGDNLTWVLDDEGTLTISGTGDMYYLDSFSPRAPWYSDRDSIGNVVINSGVTGISDYAFRGCSKLTSITIPDSVTNIGSSAFSGCDSLTSVTIGNGVTSIGNYAFENCTSLTNITVGSNNAYYSSSDGVLFNKDKTELICCPGGKSGAYTIPNSVTSIGDYAFMYCESLTSITIPDSVTSIGEEAFYYCTSLTSITIPDGVTTISYASFAHCESLTSITIPDSVTYIRQMAFYYCESLTSITIPDSVTRLGYATFRGCTSLTSVTIGNSVTEIGEYEFRDCTSLTSVTIGNSVKYIDSGAFYCCGSLTSVTIPDTVTKIGDEAFYNCYRLTDVYYSGSEDEWNEINIGKNNECLTRGTIHFNSYVITDDKDKDEDEQSDVSFGFSGSLYTNPTRGLAGESVTLYGYFDTDDESFDASAALKGVSWSVSGVSATVTSASIGYSSAAPTTTGEEKTRYEWSITVVLGSEFGDVKITGTTSDGNTASYTLEVYEPEMELKAPSSIYTLTSLNTPQQITCTVTIDDSNPQYLENFMKELGSNGSIVFEYDYDCPIKLKIDSSSYEISSDGKKAVYTINVYADHESHVIQEDVITAKVTFRSPSGKEASVNTDLALYLPSIDAWPFSNSGQETSVDQFKLVFDYDGSNLAKKVFKKAKSGSEGGICYGMALSSVSTYCDNPSVSQWISSSKTADATEADRNNSARSYDVTLNDFMMGLFVYQYSYEAMYTKLNNTNKIENLITAVERFQSGIGNPVIISVRQNGQGHALVGYEVERDDNEIRVYVYDCNCPRNNLVYISFTCNDSGSVTGWSYKIDTQTTFASSTGGSISYNDSVQNASNIVLSGSTVELSSLDMLKTDTTLLSSTADPFTITTSAGETVIYNNGNIEGTASGVVPIQADCYSLDNPDAVEDTADFYLDDIGTFTVQNNGSADEKVSTLYADDHSDITIYSDGRSTVTLNETNDVFNASVVPTVTDTVTMVFSTDDEKTIFEVAGITGETTNMSAVCDENQVKFSGIDAGTVTVTSGETTTSVNFDSNGGDNEYYATLSDDGSVSVELAAEVDNANNGSTSNTGNTVSTGSTGSTGSTSSSSAKGGDSTAETAGTGSASDSADESSQGSNTASSSSGKTSPATGASIGVVALVMVVSCGAAVLTLIRRRRRNTEN